MKKQAHFMIEYLATSKTPLQGVFATFVHVLEREMGYAPSHFSHEKLCILMKHQGLHVPTHYASALESIDAILESTLPQVISQGAKRLFITLLQANFPHNTVALSASLSAFKASLAPAQQQIYEALLAYVTTLQRTLGLIVMLYPNAPSPAFINAGEALHDALLHALFSQEEHALVAQGLREFLAVYLSLYGTMLCQREEA